MGNAEKLHILHKKTALLLKGVDLTPTTFKPKKPKSVDIDLGRKGGAGPLGGRYFLLDDKSTVVNVPLRKTLHSSNNLELKHVDGDSYEVYDNERAEIFHEVKLIPNPKFYDKETSEGFKMRKIALVHGFDSLASTVYQKCKHWACGEACKFCGIELSLKYKTTILEKNAKQLSEVIHAAKKEGRCTHLTLTTGTMDSEDKGAEKYIQLLKEVKKEHPEIPIHIQIEPMKDLTYLSMLKEAGADTIGIHIELMKESLRKKYTPGKSKTPYKTFKNNWNEAINVFGDNQVETYLLYGFRESKSEFLEDTRKIVSLGVIPYITPVRSVPHKKPTVSPPDARELISVYEEVGIMMKDLGVNPLQHKAGCVRCGGCSAINEAYMAA